MDSISIAGGDPLVHPDIVEIVRIIRHEYNVKPIINTFAWALGEQEIVGVIGGLLAREGYVVTLADIYKDDLVDRTGLPFVKPFTIERAGPFWIEQDKRKTCPARSRRGQPVRW